MGSWSLGLVKLCGSRAYLVLPSFVMQYVCVCVCLWNEGGRGAQGAAGAESVAVEAQVPVPEHDGRVRARGQQRPPPVAVAGHRRDPARLVRRLLGRPGPVPAHRRRQVLFFHLALPSFFFLSLSLDFTG